MHTRPEHILVFRSGRHLGAAIAALRAASPGCAITVVARPEAAAALDEAGIEPARRVIYDRTPFFQPLPFLASGSWRQAVAVRADRVCVLWNAPDGAGQANVDYTALTVAPRGFTAITPDGVLHPRRSVANLRRESVRAARSVAVAAFLGLMLFLPARLMAIGRGDTRGGTA